MDFPLSECVQYVLSASWIVICCGFVLSLGGVMLAVLAIATKYVSEDSFEREAVLLKKYLLPSFVALTLLFIFFPAIGVIIPE